MAFGNIPGQQFLYYRLIHSRRPYHCRKSSLRLDLNIWDKGSNKSHTSHPVRSGRIYRALKMYVFARVPIFKFVEEEYISRTSAAKENMNLSEISAVVKDIFD
jgi:uncharacterized protein YqfB (UPF0267 family)